MTNTEILSLISFLIVVLLTIYIAKVDLKLIKDFLKIIISFKNYIMKFAKFDVFLLAALQYYIFIYLDWFDLTRLELLIQFGINIWIIFKIQTYTLQSKKISWKAEIATSVFMNIDSVSIGLLIYYYFFVFGGKFIRFLSSTNKEFKENVDKISSQFLQRKNAYFTMKLTKFALCMVPISIFFGTIDDYLNTAPIQLVYTFIYNILLYILFTILSYIKRFNENLRSLKYLNKVRKRNITRQSYILLYLKFIVNNRIYSRYELNKILDD